MALEDPADEPLARRPNTDAATDEIGAARVQDSSARWDPGRAIDDLGPGSSEAPTLAAPDLAPAPDDDSTTVGWAAYTAVRRANAPGERAGGGTVLDLAALEERLAGRALALMGGVALILGAVFFLSLAFSRGWIGPDMQVLLGLAGGAAAVLVGGALLLHGDRIVGHVLTAVGLAIISLSFFAAISIYALLSPVVGLAGTLVAAGLVTAIAVASRAQVVAGFGLVAVLAAPPILGADADLLTLAYLAIVLSGVAVVSVWQTWSWLPATAFLLSAPQVYVWITSEPAVEMAFLALLAYWALMAVSAGGESFRRARPELSLSAAPLFMVSGAFVCVMAFSLMPQVSQQVAFLLTLALMHTLMATFFLVRRGPVDPFGLLAASYGLALASMAVPLAFGASLTAVVWSAEAATLAVVAGRRAHGPSLLASLVFLALAGLRIAATASEPSWLSTAEAADGLAISLAFYLLATLVTCAAVPSRAVRLLVVGMACLACLPVVGRELDGTVAVATWTALAVVTMTATRWLTLLPERAVAWQLGPALEWLLPPRSMSADAALVPSVAAALAGLLALLATAFAIVIQDGRPAIPFSDEAGLSAVVVAGGCLLVAGLGGSVDGRRRGIIAAGVIIAVEGLFQLPLVWAAVLWALLSAVALWLGRTDDGGRVSYVWAAAGGLVAVAGATLLIAPPSRLVVALGGPPPHPLFLSEATVAIGSLAVALVLAARLHPRAPWAPGVLAAGGIAGLYLISIGIVDVFAAEAFGPPRSSSLRLDELAKEAHVALSITWAAVGVLVTAAGLLLKQAELRTAGLAVLALASVKVFVFDLSSLDIAYRVITLIVLGVLLIASALAWTRLKPEADPGAPGDDSADSGEGLSAAPTRTARHGGTAVR